MKYKSSAKNRTLIFIIELILIINAFNNLNNENQRSIVLSN